MAKNLKYAIISDIHGNKDALTAVLKDAEQQHVDNYIFLGDLTGWLLYPNEVIDIIRQLKDAIVIHGNAETYLKNLADQDESTWIYDQLAPSYQDYRIITRENKDYLLSLPANKTVLLNNELTYLSHSPFDIFGKSKANELGGKHYAVQMREKQFSHDEYLQHASALLYSDEGLKARLKLLHEDIFLFGHFHTQWHAEVEGKLLINPGSCGMPFDGDTRSPYTILCYINDRRVVEERRVPYDTGKLINDIKNSPFYMRENVWGRLIENGIKTAINQILFFLEHTGKIADEVGDTKQPFSNTVWQLAASKWNFTI